MFGLDKCVSRPVAMVDPRVPTIPTLCEDLRCAVRAGEEDGDFPFESCEPVFHFLREGRAHLGGRSRRAEHPASQFAKVDAAA